MAKIVELALKYKGKGVVAVDMAGNELLPLDLRHIQGFLDAKANGLHVTVHAGESGPADNVRQVMRVCPHFVFMIVQASMKVGPEVLESCPHFRGRYVQSSMKVGPEDVSLLESCPHFRGCYVQASMELGPEDVSLLERCPHFRGRYVQASMELGPEDVLSCPHLRSGSCLYSTGHCRTRGRANRSWLPCA